MEKMDDFDGSHDVQLLAYVREIIKALRDNKAKMRLLEESNKMMIETIIQIKSSSTTTS